MAAISARLRRLIYRAYDIIGDATPIPADCGQLCDGACCKGDDTAGMLLFPGEAVMLSQVPNFRVFRMRYMDSRAWLLTCDGTCDRSLRPLSCRIFPLGLHVEENGLVTAMPDPRARPVCPLTSGDFLDRRFQKAVQEAFTLLAREPKMLDFMRLLSREQDELRRFII